MSSCRVFSTLDDIEKYCFFDNWGGNGEYPVEICTLQAAREFFSHNLHIERTVEASLSGLIILQIFVTSTKYIEIVIGPETHQILLLNGKISFEKSFSNLSIELSCRALKSLIETYQYFLV